MVRHLAGAGIGVVAVPVLVLLSWGSMREQQAFNATFDRGHALAFLLCLLLLGAAVGVLSGGRLVSPVASLVSGLLLLVLSGLYWLPFVAMSRPLPLGSFLDRALGYTPMIFVLSVVLLVASAWPSRWRVQSPPNASPRPLSAPEVRP